MAEVNLAESYESDASSGTVQAMNTDLRTAADFDELKDLRPSAPVIVDTAPLIPAATISAGLDVFLCQQKCCHPA